MDVNGHRTWLDARVYNVDTSTVPVLTLRNRFVVCSWSVLRCILCNLCRRTQGWENTASETARSRFLKTLPDHPTP